MRGLPICLGLGAATMLGACTQNVDTVRGLDTSGAAYNDRLAKDYKDFALYEYDKMYDTIDADHFAGKAIKARANDTVMPESPDRWGIEDKAKLIELRQARAKLVKAMHDGAAAKAPAALARAQVDYDCWVEQQEEGHQPTHIAACRDGFQLAMLRLDEAMAPKQVAATPEAAAPAPEPAKPPVSRLPQSLMVHFDFDSARLDDKAQDVIDEAVETYRKNDGGRIMIVGHADRAGPKDYNYQLSLKRGEAVRRTLRGYGIPSGDIVLRAEGESRPMVQTGDGVRNPANRVVRITLERTLQS